MRGPALGILELSLISRGLVVADAMMKHPDMVSGERRSDLALMTAGRGDWVTKIGAEGVQVMETVRIEQAQTRKVAVLTQLFRGRSQQQNAGNDFGQLLDQRVFRAGLVFMPYQVVRFVDALPKSPVGKILRKELRMQAG